MSDTTMQAADALVIFGITGDLARKMTFRCLYRLEVAGRLNCPIIGVAKTTGPRTTRSPPYEKPSRWPSGRLLERCSA